MPTKFDDLIIDTELDQDNELQCEMQCSSCYDTSYDWFTRETAIKTIKHLMKLFDIGKFDIEESE